MRLDELPTSDRIEDRRRIPGGRAGLGMVVVLGLLAWAFGIDPRVLIGGRRGCPETDKRKSKPTLGPTGRRPTRWGILYPPFLVAQRQNERISLRKPAKLTHRRHSSCFQVLPSRLAD
jgi:hypothetical protein